MTDRQLATLAMAAARRTTVTYRTWKKNKDEGRYPNGGKDTAWGELFGYLSQIGVGGSSEPAPTPVPSTSLAALAVNMVFCAQGSEVALNAPHGWPVALTADPAYASWANPGLVAQLHAQGRRIYAWGVQTQIGAEAIIGLRDHLGLDGAIFQAETSEEYATAMGARAQIIIGNPNAWTDLQRRDAADMIGRGLLAVIGECYTNLGGPWPEAYSAGGVPVCSLCLGVYDGKSENANGWYPTVAAYKQHTPAALWKNVGVYHAAGLRPEDWQALA